MEIVSLLPKKEVGVIHVKEPSEKPRWTLLAVGDFGIHSISQRQITPDLASLIQHSNISVVNLEGPLCRGGNPIPKDGPSIYVDPGAVKMLKEAGFNVVTLANNHIMDYGSDSLKATLERCRKAGLLTCGAGMTVEEAFRPVELEIASGIKVSILAMCEREFSIVDDYGVGSAWISHPLTLESIRKAKQESNVVVVIAHGGRVGVPFPPMERQVQLRQLVDAGADLVIGHHPHVPQGWEQYRNGFIFYSLGDFLFYLPNNKRPTKTDLGLMVQFHFNGSSLIDINLIPIEIKEGTVKRTENTKECLTRLYQLAELTSNNLAVCWQETVVHLFTSKYLPFLSKFKSRKADYLKLLNWLRCESHYWTLKKALSILAGENKYLHSSKMNEVRGILFGRDEKRLNRVKELVQSKNLKFVFYHVLEIINRRISLPLLKAFFKSYKIVDIRAHHSEKHLTKYMIPRHNKCFIDVGANVGWWTLFVAKQGYKVHAFEPSPNSYYILKERTKKHQNIHIYPYALGASKYETKIYLHDISGHDSLVKQKPDFSGDIAHVQVKSLDSFKLQNVGVIKIDTEGYEIPILLGAKQTIQKNKPRLIIEVHEPYEEQMEKIKIFLRNLNYRWVICRKGKRYVEEKTHFHIIGEYKANLTYCD